MTVFKRADRKKKPWTFQWDEPREDGGRPKRRSESFETEREAKMAEAKWLLTQNKDMPVDTDISLVDYMQLWMDTYKKPVVSENTMTKYVTSKNIIESYFGDAKVRDITRTKYQRFINWYIDDGYGHKHSKQSVEKLHSHTHQVLLSALDDGYLLRDPAVRAALGGTDGKQEEEKFLQADDFEKLRDYADRFAGPTRIGLSMVQFAIYTGCRISEIRSLTWDDVDEKANTVFVHHSYTHTWKPQRDAADRVIWPGPEKVFLPVKNHETRKLDVSPVLIKSLHRLILAAKVRGKENPYHLIFLGQNGLPPTDTDANKEMRRAMKRIGIYDDNVTFSFHGLRHSHGSYLLSQGVKVDYVSKRLGHKNMAITLKIYAHVLERVQNEEAQKAVRVL